MLSFDMTNLSTDSVALEIKYMAGLNVAKCLNSGRNSNLYGSLAVSGATTLGST